MLGCAISDSRLRLFKTKVFARFARKVGIRDQDLRKAAAAVARGNYDADLGGGVYKQRIARSDEGKSGGFRTILLLREGSNTFFVHGFSKSAQANITLAQLHSFRRLAREMLVYTIEKIDDAVRGGALIEVERDDNEAQKEKGAP